MCKSIQLINIINKIQSYDCIKIDRILDDKKYNKTRRIFKNMADTCGKLPCCDCILAIPGDDGSSDCSCGFVIYMESRIKPKSGEEVKQATADFINLIKSLRKGMKLHV